jgi:hypothetical protein
MPQVHVDSEVLKLIQSNHIFPNEDANAVLRRLLKIDKTPGGWYSQGVFLPDGTKIRMGYGDDPALNGEIKAGQWVIKGRKFQSPSTAATAFVIRSRGRKNARVNGWHYWHVLPPGANDWALLDSLRLRAAMPAGSVVAFATGRRTVPAGAHGRAS